MSYLEREQSDYGGHPLELYRFALGAEQWLYTSADQEVVYAGGRYQPVFIKRSGFTRGRDLQKSNVEIEVAPANPVALKFRAGWLTGIMVVTIYAHHHLDADFVAVWKGRAVAANWRDTHAVIMGESMATLFRQTGLRRRYQVGCPHALYGPGCRVAKESYRLELEVIEAEGNQVRLAGAGSLPAGWCVGGMLTLGQDGRLVTAHNGDTLTLVDALEGLAAGTAVSVWPGCDRTLATCAAKFNNHLNMGGLPFLPPKNPFAGDAIV